MISKKFFLKIMLAHLFFTGIDAAVPCGTSNPGVLNVGILPDNLPWSDIVSNQAIGFDPLLIVQVAKLLGYSKVNFISYANNGLALAALNAGTIDIYANSSNIVPINPVTSIGIVTDISQIYNVVNASALGWFVNIECCTLAEQLDAVITQLVHLGVYAQILQAIRLAGQTNGFTLGFPATASGITGILVEPFPFASNELGTIPPICSPSGPNLFITLPKTNCIGSYLQANCAPLVTFTGVVSQN